MSAPKIHGAYEALDHVYRQGWIDRGIPNSKGETVQAHTKKLLRAVELYPATSGGLNKRRMILMTPIHDIGEYKVPDYTPSDKISSAEKHELERQAIRELAEGSGVSGKLMLELWEEYNAKITPEAQLVSQLDKLDAAIQAFEYEKMGYPTADFYPYVKSKLTDPLLIQIFDRLMASPTPQRNYYEQYFELLAGAK